MFSFLSFASLFKHLYQYGGLRGPGTCGETGSLAKTASCKPRTALGALHHSGFPGRSYSEAGLLTGKEQC